MSIAARVRPRLALRLRVLRDLLPPGSVADVGAGHGALAAHLAAGGRRVIAIEAQRGPLAELRANLEAWGMEPLVATRLGVGLDPIAPGEVDGAVAAGLGGYTLVAIASAAPAAGLRWVALQCVQRASVLEAWLDGPAAAGGWRVLDAHRIAERGRVYPTWVLGVGRGTGR